MQRSPLPGGIRRPFQGSLVVADNVLAPGAPEYRAWILNHTSFKTEVRRTLLEYTRDVPDEVLISVWTES
jgi:predicted O-methyltransferase YrrM